MPNAVHDGDRACDILPTSVTVEYVALQCPST